MRNTRLLFICTGNRDRSPTAEDLCRNLDGYEAKSAGTSSFATQTITQELIDWADKIFVMCEAEDRHLTFLKSRFKLGNKDVYDLDIPDQYERGSERLKRLLWVKLAPYLKR
ncbi:MAG: phosphotyrosine protein phosphatase [Terriglobales bacterium]